MTGSPPPLTAAGRSRKKGNVLLLSLLILSTIVMSATGLGSLIISSLQQTRIIDSSIVAYYAAESAAEEVIYDVRKTTLAPTWMSDLTVMDQPTVLDNGASWTRQVSNAEPVIYASIPQDSLLEVGLYDPDQESVSLATAIRKVALSWTNDPCVPEDNACPKLHASLIKWDPNATAWDESSAESMEFTSGATGGSDVIVLSAPADLYKLRLRAQGGDLKTVEIRAYSDDEMKNAVDLPGRVRIDAWGRFGGTQQHLTVRMPRRTPLSGIYDFAVFSECSLVKGYTISCP